MSPKKKENIVPCLLWVSKGVSQSVPDLIQLSLPKSKENKDTREIDPCFEEDTKSSDEEEVDNEFNEGTQPNESDDEDEAKNETTSNLAVDSDEEIVSKYDLDNYDDSDEDRQCTSIENLQMFPSNKEDEYLEDSDEEDKIEEENNKIKPDDNLLVVGRYKGVKIDEKDDDDIVIEVYVYNKEEGSFYVHHYMNLKAIPVAIEWLDFHPSDEKKGSCVAVGDMSGKISVWDLDVDGQEVPDYTLERENINEVVNCLGWNKNLRNILASGYSDGIIVLWNLLTCREEKVLTYHKESVQTLEWDPFEARYILSGCTKGYIKLYDHQKDGDQPSNSWKIKGEIEKVCWNKVMSSKFFCATHRGFVYSFDVSSGLQFRIKTHKNCVTALDLSPDYPNLLMTGSFDRFIKVWDLDHINDESKQTLKPIYRRKTEVDKIFSAKFAPDSELVLAVGGNSEDNNLKILDLEDLNPDNRRNGEDTTQNNFSENYSDQSPILKTSNGKKRKIKVKNHSAEEEGKGISAPAKKKHKKNLTETSTQNGNSVDTNSQTNFLHRDKSSKSKNGLAKKKEKTQSQIN